MDKLERIKLEGLVYVGATEVGKKRPVKICFVEFHPCSGKNKTLQVNKIKHITIINPLSPKTSQGD